MILIPEERPETFSAVSESDRDKVTPTKGVPGTTSATIGALCDTWITASTLLVLGRDREDANMAGNTTVALRDCSGSESENVCKVDSRVVRRTRCIDVVDVAVLMAYASPGRN